ncbi:unnamed protein product [Symbiodinium sp. CCMP2592]|nr:unnamed protein product [Symbiodinium sp. CCMP2592]
MCLLAALRPSHRASQILRAGQATLPRLERIHQQLEAKAAAVVSPRKATLKEFLLDPSFQPPVLEYFLEEREGQAKAKIYQARVDVGGTSYAGAPGGREETQLSAALVALRALRAPSRGHDSTSGRQELVIRVPRGRSLRTTTKAVAGGKHESNLRWIERNSGAKVSLVGGQKTGEPLRVKVSGDTGSCQTAADMVRELLALLPHAKVQADSRPRSQKSLRGFAVSSS